MKVLRGFSLQVNVPMDPDDCTAEYDATTTAVGALVVAFRDSPGVSIHSGESQDLGAWEEDEPQHLTAGHCEVDDDEVYDRAESLYASNSIQIEHGGVTSEADGGTWVQAWVWVEDEEGEDNDR